MAGMTKTASASNGRARLHAEENVRATAENAPTAKVHTTTTHDGTGVSSHPN
jgi:hypothetical protein